MAKKFFAHADFQSVSRIINLPAPQNAGDAVNKGYVDSFLEGLAWKDNCRVRAQGNVNLSAPGATIDGVTMASQDRFLAPLQTTTSQNGIYVWNGPSAPATRALDASTFAELEQAITAIDEGTSAGTTWRQDQVNGTIDTNPLNWVPFAPAAPAATESTSGTAEIATQVEVNTGTDDQRIVTPAKLAAWSGRIKKFAVDIGDASATAFTVTHNLGTLDVTAAIFANSNGEEVIVDVLHATANTLTVTFASAPASNAYRVVVIG
jgi:hypothetical protein